MQGKVLTFDPNTGQGIISGDDGQRYNFDAAGLGGGVASVRAGQSVDFEIGDMGNASSIFVMQSGGQGGLGAEPVGQKNRVLAGLLGIFLGGLGVHKFYMGMTTAGLIMLGVCIFGVIIFGLGPIAMGIIGLIEGIIYITKTDQDFYDTYEVGQKQWF
ncbi:MAG: NINE protein [Pseudomonadota bacterium]